MRTRSPRTVSRRRTHSGWGAGRRWEPGAFAAISVAGLVLVGATAGAFALLLALVEAEWQPLEAADVAIVEAVNSEVSANGGLATAAKAITHLGSPIGVAVAVVVPVIALLIRRLPRAALFIAVTGLGAAVLGTGVKELVERARPLVDVPLSSPSGASFPSGHATAVTIAWGALILVFLPAVPHRWRRAVAAAAIGLVVLVGVSRVALGAHYLSDVVGGWLVGVVWLSVTAAAFRRSRGMHGVTWSVAGLDDLAPRERRALQPAPAGERVLPGGGSTAAKLLVAGVVLAGMVIGLGFLILQELALVRRLDERAVESIVAIGDGTLTELIHSAGRLGGVSGIVAVGAIAIPLACAITRHWRPALFLFIAAAGQGLIYLAASRVVDRARPDAGAPDAGLLTPVSFPSGHVGAAVASYGAIALLTVAWSRAPARFGAIPLAMVVVGCVAFTRLHLGVHYPTDVITGAAYALVWLSLCYLWLQPVPARREGEDDGELEARQRPRMRP